MAQSRSLIWALRCPLKESVDNVKHNNEQIILWADCAAAETGLGLRCSQKQMT